MKSNMAFKTFQHDSDLVGEISKKNIIETVLRFSELLSKGLLSSLGFLFEVLKSFLNLYPLPCVYAKLSAVGLIPSAFIGISAK